MMLLNSFIGLILLFESRLVSAAYAKFNEAFTSSMLDKVTSAVAVPWTPLGSIAAAFSSYRVKGSDSTSVDGHAIMDDNATAAALWMLMKPYVAKSASPIDALYVGFENAKLIMYLRKTAYPKRPLSFGFSRDENYTCYQNNTPFTGCYVQWDNATDPVTGAYEGGPTQSTSFDCRVRPWYQDSKASTEVIGGAVGAIWSDPYLLIQTGTLGLAAARQLVTKDGDFVGVAGIDFELSTVENLLQDTTAASGGTLTVFVVDSAGRMISSSVRGTVVNSAGTSQVRAANSSNRVIRAVGQEVDARGGWATTAGEVVTIDVASLGLYWFQHLNLTDPYGLKWHVAVAQVVQCDRGFFVSLTLPKDGTGKECLPCPEGAICSGGTAMPFPKEGWWIDRSSYTAGGVAFRCLRGTCEGFQARAKEWALRDSASGNDFDFGGFSTVDGGTYDFDDDAAVADDDYVGLSGASLDPLACWHRAAFINASEAAYARSLQSSDYSLQLDLLQCSEHRLMCTPGSVGPLCGSCEEGFVFSSSARICVNCKKSITFIPSLILGISLIVAVTIRSALLKVRKQGRHEPLRQRLSRLCPALFSDVPLGSSTKHKNKNPFRHLDRGMLKVAWATFQILSTISWNLAVQYPEPFATALESLSFMSMDFSAALTCSTLLDLMDRTLFAALLPILLVFLDCMLYLARSARRRAESRAAFKVAEKERAFSPTSESTGRPIISSDAPRPLGSFDRPKVPGKGSFSFFAGRVGGVLWHRGQENGAVDHYLEAALERMRNQHVYFALALSYLVLPPVAMLQFNALDCADLSTPSDVYTNENHVLRVDTSVDCDSAAYKNFAVVNWLLIVIYQSVPLVWFCLLWRVRHLLDPMGYENSTKQHEPTALEAKNGELNDSGRKPAGNWVERISVSTGLRSSVGQLRSSQLGGHASSSRDVKKLTEEELVTKERLRLDAEERAAEYALAEAARKQNNTLRHLNFLWEDYKPSAWYYEVVEVYRRMLFAAALPILAPQGLPRAALGCVLAILAVAVVREANPFQRESTNILLVLSQYQILLTFLSAFVVASDTLASVEGDDPLYLGFLLCGINAGILFAAGLILFARYNVERKQQKWRRPRTAEEVVLLEQLLGKATASSNEINDDGDGSKAGTKGRRRFGSTVFEGQSKSSIEMTAMSPDARENASQAVLARHLLKADDVVLIDRIGAGAFGEVFRGKCLGEAVAVKTMLEVNEDNVKAFRAEILLTATLRHPNIVNFVGACWGEDLTCLVLEWVPKGSLQQLLRLKVLDLRWGEPLLRLASDVSRGMAYLHGREYLDETDQNKLKRCILHRDLKPDNVLVTEFLRAKLSDFGTSRAQGVDSDDVAMTAVGTPLFCAPEILRGEAYNASADVYSFGLLLLAMVVKDDLVDFVGERWRVNYGKKQRPRNPMRFIRAIAEEDWRAVAAPPLSSDPKGLASEIAQLAPRADQLTLMERRRLNALNHALTQARTEQMPPTTSDDAASAPLVLSDAPPTIVRLLVECMLKDTSQRPTFEDCMRELEGPAQREIAAMDFGRITLASASASAAGTKKGAASLGGGAADGGAVPSTRANAFTKHAKELSAAEQKAEEVDEAAEERRMAARNAHLLRNSLAFRANVPPSAQPHSKDAASAQSMPVVNPLNGSEPANSAAFLPPPSLPPPPPPPPIGHDSQQEPAVAVPGALPVKNKVSFAQESMRDDGRPLGADFTDV